MSGALTAAIGILAEGFKPVTTTYVTHGTYTITIPIGARTMILEGGGAGGSGGGGAGAGGGGGGASGGLVRSSFSVIGQAGKTITLTVGAGAPGVTGGTTNGIAGGNTTFTSGTFSITTMTANGGGGGEGSSNSPQNGGTAGTATGGNVVNTSGNNGTNGTGGGAPGTGIAGLYINSGGGSHAALASTSSAATDGQGAVHFS